MDQAKVSIIIPFYNAEKHLEETIQSALKQSYTNIEIIVVDDGSNDASNAIAQKFKSDRLTLVKQKNKGASAARNLGINIAKGDYIQFLDADDLLSPDKIEGQLKILHQLPGYASICRTIHFHDEDQLSYLSASSYEEGFLKYSENPVDFLVNLWGGNTPYGSMVSIHAWLTPKHLIKAAGFWNENLTYDDDGEFFSRVVLNSKGIVYSEKGYSYYRKQMAGSLSDLDSKERFESMLTAVLLKKETLLKKVNSYEAKLAIYKMLTGVALKCLPRYYKLYKIAVKALPKIDPKNYQPSIGGPITQKLATFFGWKTIRIIQYYLKLKE
ncbi:glycosyltransferase family A protein [Pedobacter nototheniae]|uniref:glycosyltransferase family 2 protein n=1 Tax=Pedobacter nototheniae TaxID=2488994 RepID=UPI00293130CA|nr:glycosyltransferase family A protein [Pedobacter nototheniae]